MIRNFFPSLYHRCPAVPANYELYRHVANEIVASPSGSDPAAEQSLKRMLLQLVTALHATPSVDPLVLQVRLTRLRTAMTPLRIVALRFGMGATGKGP
jgi:hypothetical protein